MKIVHVAVGVVIDSRQRVLVALRPQHAHQGGLWEFPGGKCEPGETIGQSLRRELHEELGIHVTQDAPLCCIRHDYPDKQVLLEVRRVLAFTGEPEGREGQAVRWVALDSLDPDEFPAANRVIIRRIRMPASIVITPDCGDVKSLEATFSALLVQRPAILHLRQPSLPSDQQRSLIPEFLLRCREQGTTLVWNTNPEVFSHQPADGLHVSAAIASKLSCRPVGLERSFSVSCHSLGELRHAEAIGADYAFLSPVAKTASHPDAKPLGWDVFASLSTAVNVPIYALGGMTPADISEAYSRGGAGIAAISAFLRAE